MSGSEVWSWPRLHEAQRSVLLDVLVHGSRSRADLARRTGLSRTSLSRLTRDLVDLGLVVEGEIAAPQGRGRPSEMLHVRAESAQFAGFKLTGDRLYASVVDLHATVLHTEEHPLDSRSVADVVAQIAQVVERLRATFSRLSAVGVCLAGDVQQRHGRAVVVGSHFLGWNEEPVEALVEAATRLPTAVSNDVQALTVGHHWFGAGVGHRSLALIGFGAGIGAGLVVHDELVRGARGHPGKVSHLRVAADGPMCDRGHVGCASAFVTIPAVLRNAGVAQAGDAAGLDLVLARAAAGDEAARSALDAAAAALGSVIAHLINLVDPETIIVTGEGLPIAERARGILDAAMTDALDPAAEPVPLELRSFRFVDYAWAAAILAIRQVV